MPNPDARLFSLTDESVRTARLVYDTKDSPERQARHLANLNAVVAELNAYLRPYVGADQAAGGA